MSAREYDGPGFARGLGCAALVTGKFRAALGPVGGALRAAGPRGGDLARGGDLIRGGDLMGAWKGSDVILGVAVRTGTGMALAPLRPAGERATGECWRERLSRPREPGRGDEMPEFEREVMADGTAGSRSRAGERCLKAVPGPYRSSRRSGRSGERDRGR